MESSRETQADSEDGDGAITSYFSNDRRALVDFAAAHTPLGHKALDVGCAAGRCAEALTGRGVREIWGVEPVEEVAREAESRMSRVIVDSFPSAEARNGMPFDLVVFADSLEHMDDPWAAVAEAGRLLAPSGLLLLSTPNVSHYSVLWQQLRGRWSYARAGLLDRAHVRFFTPLETRRMVEAAGFTPLAEDSVVIPVRRRYALLAAPARRAVPHIFTYQHLLLARARADVNA